MKPHDLNFYRRRGIITRRGAGYFVAAVLAVAGVAGFLNWGVIDYAREVTVINNLVSAPTGEVKPKFLISEKIKEGIELLKKSAPLDYETQYIAIKKGVKVRAGDLVRKQIAFAILNQKTGEVFEKRVWVADQDIQNYKKTGVIYLEPILLESDFNNYRGNYRSPIPIIVNWWNSFNTDYAIPDRPELIVVANKYLLPSDYLTGLPEKSSGKYSDIIYSPYSKQLHRQELIEAGGQYLEKQINLAFEQLYSDGVISRSRPGSAVADGVTPNFIKNIILVEHVDPGAFALVGDGGKELGERVLTVIGANQEMAYRYTGSPAGASGLAQFIKPTYDATVTAYPRARLIKNYQLGMADHVNAVKAMVLFFDSRKKEIANNVTRRDIIKSLGITEEMLAAAYNGGPNKVTRSLNTYGLAWMTSKIFRQETLDYIKKFQSIKNLDILANISEN